ncbi:MAG: hypothetical protein U0670_18860 [Anaerolineae bacterium]
MLILDWSVPSPRSSAYPRFERSIGRHAGGTAFLVAARQIAIAAAPRQITLIDLDSGAVMLSLTLPSHAEDSRDTIRTFTPADGERQLAITTDDSVYLANLHTGKITPLERPVGMLPYTPYGTLSKLLPDDHTLLVASYHLTIDVWDLRTGTRIFSLPAPPLDQNCAVHTLRDMYGSPYDPGQIVVNYEGTGEKIPYVSIDELGYSRMIGLQLAPDGGSILWDRCYSTEIQHVIFQPDGVQVWNSTDISELCCVDSKTGAVVRRVAGYWRLAGLLHNAQGDPASLVVTEARTGDLHWLRFPDFERIGSVKLPSRSRYFETQSAEAAFVYLEGDRTLARWSLHDGCVIDSLAFPHRVIRVTWCEPLRLGIVHTEDQRLHRVTLR